MNIPRPSDLAEPMAKLRAENKYAKNWIPRIERHTNCHPNRGRRWGWYEIWPLGITVGYWEEDGKNDLSGFDIEDWNNEAKGGAK